MNLRLIAVLGGGLIMGHYLHWLAGLVAAIAILVWTAPRIPAYTLMTLNNETGQLEAQPHDKLTEDYLRKRGPNGS